MFTKQRSGIVISRHGDFQVATARTKKGFTAWAKMGPITSDSPLTEPGAYVWFSLRETREEARDSLLDELGLPLGEADHVR